jgi:hypothetical protein
MRELTSNEISLVSGGEVPGVGACRVNSAADTIKTYAVALVGYLADLWK